MTLAFHVRRWWRPVWLTCAVGYALLLLLALANFVGAALALEGFRTGPSTWFLLVVSAGFGFFSLRKWRQGPERAVAFVLTGSPEER